jgi:hypothetical protein
MPAASACPSSSRGGASRPQCSTCAPASACGSARLGMKIRRQDTAEISHPPMNDASQEGSFAPVPVAERPREQQQAGQRERVRGDHPLQGGQAGVEVVADGRQRDAHRLRCGPSRAAPSRSASRHPRSTSPSGMSTPIAPASGYAVTICSSVAASLVAVTSPSSSTTAAQPARHASTPTACTKPSFRRTLGQHGHADTCGRHGHAEPGPAGGV